MSRSSTFFALLSVNIFAIFNTAVEARQGPLMDLMSLENLPGVLVVIDSVDSHAIEDGFNPDSVHTLVVQALSDAGITAFREDEWQVTLGSPALLVRVRLLRASEFLYLYGIEVEFKQLVAAVRDSAPAFAPTWRSGMTLGSVRASQVSSLAGLVLAAANSFISAHAQANRRRIR